MNTLKNLVEEVVITKVSGRNVSYDSELWSGCDIDNFPKEHPPVVGEVWKITSNWGKICLVEFVR